MSQVAPQCWQDQSHLCAFGVGVAVELSIIGVVSEAGFAGTTGVVVVPVPVVSEPVFGAS